jgi:hypothetical protein
MRKNRCNNAGDSVSRKGKNPFKQTEVRMGVWSRKQEEILVSACASILSDTHNGELPLEKAADIVGRNRKIGKPAVYIGASWDVRDFVATGLHEGVFIDPTYWDRHESDDERERTQKDIVDYMQEWLAKHGVTDFSHNVKGDMLENGKLVIEFTFHGERRKISCYAKDGCGLFKEYEPEELAGGVGHYIATHASGIGNILAWILAKVVEGGHIEAHGVENEGLAKELLGVEIVHRNIRKKHDGCRNYRFGYNIMRKIRDIEFSADTAEAMKPVTRVREDAEEKLASVS